MTTPDQITELLTFFREHLPRVTWKIDPPFVSYGAWWVDLENGVTLMWKSTDEGFGVYSPANQDFGSKPDDWQKLEELKLFLLRMFDGEKK